MSLGSVFSAWQTHLHIVTQKFKKGQFSNTKQLLLRFSACIWASLFASMLLSNTIKAQITQDPLLNTETALMYSVDSLLATLATMQQDREALRSEVSRLNNRIQSLERNVEGRVNLLISGQGSVLDGIDTLRVLMPSDEPIKATNMNVLYLNQRQDSLVAYVERLEQSIVSLPDKHYWGVRNGFQQFDHLLLFTFLGALTSLGVVLLVKGGPQRFEFDGDEQSIQEEEADRLSVSITLLVGSVLVILFIMFIL